MNTQIIKITSRKVTIKLKGDSEKSYKAPKTWGEFMEILGWLHSEFDCKLICDSFRQNLSADQYGSLRLGMFPTLSDRKAISKRKELAQKRIEAEAPGIEKLQSWYVSQPGYLGNGVSRKDIEENVNEDLKRVYGI